MTSISQMCREAGIDRKTYYNRLKRGETDLFRPTNYSRVSEELIETLKKNNISYHTYRVRRKLGWSHLEASNAPLWDSRYLYYNGKSVHSLLPRSVYTYYYRLYNDVSAEAANEYLERRLNEQRV